MPPLGDAVKGGFSPIVVSTSEFKGEIHTQSFATTTDKVKVVFSTYNHRCRWTGEWKEYLGLAVGLVGLAFSVKYKDLTIVGQTIPVDYAKAALLVIGVLFASIAARCGWRAFSFRKKLTCNYIEEQLRADSPDVE